jgi:NitT/TauT family transport system substrate-binding protein
VPLLFLLLLLAAAAACQKPAGDGLDVVRVAARFHPSAAPIFIADAEGYFAAEGIKLEFVEAPARSSQAIPLLDKGSIDVLSTSVGSGLFTAAQSSARLRMVADRGHVARGACEFNGIIGGSKAFASDSPSAKELRGKTFSINHAVTAEFVIDRFLESRGLTAGDVKAVSLSEVMEIQAFNSGAIDATHATEPFISRLRQDGHRMIGRASDFAPGAVFGVMMYGPTLIERNRALGQRFMNAYLRGVRQHAEGPTERNIEILSSRMHFDPALLKGACFPAISPDGEINERWMMEFQEWSVAKGHATRVVALDSAIDLSFARAAAARLDSIERR